MPMVGKVVGLQCCKIFNSKLFRVRNRHLNVDALSRNLVGFPEEVEDFGSDVME